MGLACLPLRRVVQQVAAYGLDDLADFALNKGGNSSNFTFQLPLDVSITLPTVSMAALGNLISIPGLTLETNGNLNVVLGVTGGFNVTGAWRLVRDWRTSHQQLIPVSEQETMEILTKAGEEFKIHDTLLLNFYKQEHGFTFSFYVILTQTITTTGSMDSLFCFTSSLHKHNNNPMALAANYSSSSGWNIQFQPYPFVASLHIGLDKIDIGVSVCPLAKQMWAVKFRDTDSFAYKGRNAFVKGGRYPISLLLHIAPWFRFSVSATS